MYSQSRKVIGVVIAATVVLAGLAFFPSAAQAATPTCVVDKTQVFAGTQVTVTALATTPAGVQQSLYIEGGGASQSSTEVTGTQQLAARWTGTVSGTTLFTCVVREGDIAIGTPGIARVEVVPDPDLQCIVESGTGLAGRYFGDLVYAEAAIARRPSGTSASVSIARNGVSIASSPSDYVVKGSIVLGNGPEDFECTGTLTITATGETKTVTKNVTFTPDPTPSPPTASVGYDAIMNQGGEAFQTVTWTVPNQPLGWELRWFSSTSGDQTPPTSVKCGDQVTLTPFFSRANNPQGRVNGPPVSAQPTCTLPQADLQYMQISGGTASGNVNFLVQVPPGTEIEVEYTIAGRVPKSVIAGPATCTNIGCFAGSWRIPESIPVPLDVQVRARAKLGSTVGPWSSIRRIVGEKPSLSYPTIRGTVGKAIPVTQPKTNANSQDLAAVNGKYSVGQWRLPKGLTLDPVTGEISGTPTSAVSGSSIIWLGDCQSDCRFSPVAATLTWDVKPSAPSAGRIAYGDIAGLTGSPVTAKPSKNGVSGSFYAQDLCTRFPGLDIDSTSGMISGTPTSLASGSLQVQVFDQAPAGASGCVAPQGSLVAKTSLKINIDQGLTFTYPQTAMTTPVGQPITPLTPTAPTGAQLAGTTFSVTGGALPPGLTLDPGTGVISGTPTTAGTKVHVTLTASRSGQSISTDVDFSTFAVTGSGAPYYPDVSSPIGVAKSVTPASASGWSGPFLLAAGAPAGMTIDPATGQISWTPTAPQGPRTITVSATSPANTVTSIAPFTWTVLAGPASTRGTTPIGASGAQGATTGGPGGSGASGIATPCVAPAGMVYTDMHGSVGATFTFAPNLAEIAADSTFALIDGSLPPGVYLDPQAGVISGTPETVGTWTPKIAAIAPDGTRRVSDVAIYVDDPHHAANYPNQIRASVGSPLTVTPFEVNAHGPTTYALVCGSLPAGVTLDEKTGVIAGTPSAPDATPIPLRIRMTDDYGSVDSSFIITSEAGQIPWMRYPEYAEIGSGLRTTITPTVSALPTVASFEIDGEIPEGLSFDSRTGVISGVALVRDDIVYEPTITALDAGGQPLTSTWSSITVIKPAVPMHVKARAAKKKITKKKTTVVTTVRHPKYTTLSADVFCTGCTWTFNKKSGKLTIKKPKKKTQVTVFITALPKGPKAKSEFAGHEWYRTWKVR